MACPFLFDNRPRFNAFQKVVPRRMRMYGDRLTDIALDAKLGNVLV